MISEAHKFIFIHPAKTGGTSIETALAPYSENELRKDGFLGGNPQVIHNGDEIKHARLDHFRQQLGPKLSEYFVFATCRNPWDRIVSAWCWYNRIRNAVSFDDFCGFLYRRQDRGPTNNFRYLRPLIDPCIDFVRQNPPFDIQWIRFENLQDGFDDICAELDIPLMKLPHELKTDHGHYSEYYDNDSRERVARFFARDIRRFRYAFEGVA
jgi:hypothetical protein